MILGSMVIGGSARMAEYIGSHSSTANASSYSFNGVSIGTPADDRLVVIGAIHVGDDAGNRVSGLTVDGVAATRIGGFLASNLNPMGWFAIEKPAGAIADIVVTFGVQALNCVIFIWTVRNAASLLPFDESAGAGATTDAFIDLSIPGRGVGLFIGGHHNSNPATWSGATQVDALTVESRAYSAAELIATSELIDHRETRSWSGSNQAGLAGVAFEPRSGAYPVLNGRVGSATLLDANSSSFSVALPDGIAAGEMLAIVVSARAGGARTVSTPSGWTELYNVIGGGDFRRQAGFYRVADGSEGSSVTVSASGNCLWAASALRIGKHTGQIEALTASGSSSTADPPALSPSWGSAATLWLTVAGDMANNFDDPVKPSGFALPATAANVYLGNMRIRSTSAARRQTTATMNPSAFSLPASNQWVAATIAIR